MNITQEQIEQIEAILTAVKASPATDSDAKVEFTQAEVDALTSILSKATAEVTDPTV